MTHVTRRLTAKNRDQPLLPLRLIVDYGLPLPFLFSFSFSRVLCPHEQRSLAVCMDGVVLCDLSLVQTVGHDPMTSGADSRQFGVEWMTLDELWPQADYITLHTPLIPHTRRSLPLYSSVLLTYSSRRPDVAAVFIY